MSIRAISRYDQWKLANGLVEDDGEAIAEPCGSCEFLPTCVAGHPDDDLCRAVRASLNEAREENDND